VLGNANQRFIELSLLENEGVSVLRYFFSNIINSTSSITSLKNVVASMCRALQIAWNKPALGCDLPSSILFIWLTLTPLEVAKKFYATSGFSIDIFEAPKIGLTLIFYPAKNVVLIFKVI